MAAEKGNPTCDEGVAVAALVDECFHDRVAAEMEAGWSDCSVNFSIELPRCIP